MTKGKLYSEVYNKASRMQDKSYECYDAVGLDAVNDLLAEAQKDFPKTKAGDWITLYYHEIDKWCKKWLGDE